MERIIQVLTLTAFLTALCGSTLHAEVLHVPDEYETIQDAIYETEDGDTVLVDPGEYEENIDFIGTNIVVASHFINSGDEDDIENTIIDGGRHDAVVIFASEEDESAQLIGFTITNGESNQAGGIWISGASPTLSHLVVRNNIGFGISILESDLEVTDLIVRNNTSYGILTANSTFSLLNSEVNSNRLVERFLNNIAYL